MDRAAQHSQRVVDHAGRIALQSDAIERNGPVALGVILSVCPPSSTGDGHHRRAFRLRLGGKFPRVFFIDLGEKGPAVGLGAIENVKAADRRPLAFLRGVDLE